MMYETTAEYAAAIATIKRRIRLTQKEADKAMEYARSIGGNTAKIAEVATYQQERDQKLIERLTAEKNAVKAMVRG